MDFITSRIPSTEGLKSAANVEVLSKGFPVPDPKLIGDNVPKLDFIGRLLSKQDPSDLLPVDADKPELERPPMTLVHGPPRKILPVLPPQFTIIEKPLPISQGLLRVQNFNAGDRYCRSSIQSLEGVIPLPNVLVRTLFSPEADCITVAENGTDFTVALPTEPVINITTVLFILCLRKRPLLMRTEEGEITEDIRRVMQVLRPACAEFIEQEENPPEEVAGDPYYFPARFIRFVFIVEGNEYQAAVNTEGQFRLLDEPESALSSLDDLRERILRPFQPAPVVDMRPAPKPSRREKLYNAI